MNHRDAATPPTDENQVESEIQAKGLIAPRVTPAQIDAQILRANYLIAGQAITRCAA